VSGAGVPVRRTGRPRADATDAERDVVNRIKGRTQRGEVVAAWVAGEQTIVCAYPARNVRTPPPPGALLAGVYTAPAPALPEIAADLRAAQAAQAAQARQSEARP
jgi:hypothetical protein